MGSECIDSEVRGSAPFVALVCSYIAIVGVCAPEDGNTTIEPQQRMPVLLTANRAGPCPSEATARVARARVVEGGKITFQSSRDKPSLRYLQSMVCYV